MGETPLQCSFCERPRLECRRLITAPGERAAICDECVFVCVTILPPETPGPGEPLELAEAA